MERPHWFSIPKRKKACRQRFRPRCATSETVVQHRNPDFDIHNVGCRVANEDDVFGEPEIGLCV